MADVGLFLREDARKLLKGKKILFLGDSILRNIYQDMLWLLEHGTLTPQNLFNKKGVQIETFCGDKLVPGTGELDPGTNYWEVREFTGGSKLEGMTATYVFLTRCFSKRLEDFIYKNREDPPDIVLVLSALWDVSKWGPSGIREYKENCPKLLNLLTATFPQSTQVIWLTTPPIAAEVWGGLEFNVIDANEMVANYAKELRQDIVDLHFWMKYKIPNRMPDGIHWTPDAIRMQLNVILTHLCMSRGLTLPGRRETPPTDENDNVMDYQIDDTKSPTSEDGMKGKPTSSSEPKGKPTSSFEPKGKPTSSKESKMKPTSSTESKEKISTESKEKPTSLTKSKVNSTESILNDYTDICWSCSKTKLEVQLNTCSGCMRAKYCSRKCIEHDWPVHGPWCLKQQKKRGAKI